MPEELGVKGAAFTEDFDHITKKRGKDGLVELDRFLKNKGYPYTLAQLDDMRVYPIEYRIDFLKALKEAFGWSDKDIFNMARNAPKVHSALKFFVKYFVSLDMAFNSAGKYWTNYFTFGRLVPKEFDKKNGTIKLTLYDFTYDDDLNNQLSGYFVGVMALTKVKDPRFAKLVKIKEDASEIEFHLSYAP